MTVPGDFELAELRPMAFVDDYLPYLRGVPPDVHAALITRGAIRGPDTGPETALAKSTHLDLAAFSDFRLQHNSRCPLGSAAAHTRNNGSNHFVTAGMRRRLQPTAYSTSMSTNRREAVACDEPERPALASKAA
jgi:hypothetical protein